MGDARVVLENCLAEAGVASLWHLVAHVEDGVGRASVFARPRTADLEAMSVFQRWPFECWEML